MNDHDHDYDHDDHTKYLLAERTSTLTNSLSWQIRPVDCAAIDGNWSIQDTVQQFDKILSL